MSGGQSKDSPGKRYSPLLEVNSTGSLLIVKSHSSNRPHDAQRAQRLPGSSKIPPHTHTLCRFCLLFHPPLIPFLPSRSLKRLSLTFKLFSLDLSPPPPSFPYFPPPLCFSYCLSIALALCPANCLHGYLCCIQRPSEITLLPARDDEFATFFY